jgi:hypothetical protein
MSEYKAKWIDEYSFGYTCDLCPDEHVHGCCRDFITNRTENRGSHCTKHKGVNNVNIKITKDTERRLNRQNMEIYLNSVAALFNS